MIESFPRSGRLRLVADIVSAHVANNTITPADLPELIRSVYALLDGLGMAAATLAASMQKPAVPVEASVFRDYIVCLEDGKRLRLLKRHLNASYGMTPQQYREKWGLPDSYPMVAPGYAIRRSVLAKHIGLGRKQDASTPGQRKVEIQRIPAGVSAFKTGYKKRAA